MAPGFSWAYQSLLRRTRQQYHHRIAQVLEARFPALCQSQPELLAQHSTAAGLHTQTLGYWQQAGQRALQRSAQALAYAQDLCSRAYALFWTALLLQCCGRSYTVYEQAAEALALSTEHGFTLWQRGSMIL